MCLGFLVGDGGNRRDRREGSRAPRPPARRSPRTVPKRRKASKQARATSTAASKSRPARKSRTASIASPRSMALVLHPPPAIATGAQAAGPLREWSGHRARARPSAVQRWTQAAPSGKRWTSDRSASRARLATIAASAGPSREHVGEARGRGRQGRNGGLKQQIGVRRGRAMSNSSSSRTSRCPGARPAATGRRAPRRRCRVDPGACEHIRGASWSDVRQAALAVVQQRVEELEDARMAADQPQDLGDLGGARRSSARAAACSSLRASAGLSGPMGTSMELGLRARDRVAAGEQQRPRAGVRASSRRVAAVGSRKASPPAGRFCSKSSSTSSTGFRPGALPRDRKRAPSSRSGWPTAGGPSLRSASRPESSSADPRLSAIARRSKRPACAAHEPAVLVEPAA